MKQVVIVGIGTDVGKTIVSSILVEKFKCDYWKPIQSGDLDNSDSIKVKNLCSHEASILPEKYKLTQPFSPHYSAEIDKVEIIEEKLHIPFSQNNILIEAAGGLMVPLNNKNLLFIDIIKSWNLPVILVSRHYLGSINHTMLSLEILKANKIDVKALIWIGNEEKPNEIASENAILNRFNISKTHKIPFTEKLDKTFVKSEANKINFEIF
jgi:dethiobiotin synthetase